MLLGWWSVERLRSVRELQQALCRHLEPHRVEISNELRKSASAWAYILLLVEGLRSMKTADKIATIAFRAVTGIIGFGVLCVAIKFEFYKSVHGFMMSGGFCGLLLGYAIGGDKWGARMFGLFTGHRIPEE